MVKILRYDIPINNFNNREIRPVEISAMEKNLNEWSQAGWRIVSVQSDVSGEVLVYLEK